MGEPNIHAAINRRIGKRLASIMEARGETRASIASALGTTEARVARVVKGSSALTAAELVIAAKALGVHISILTT